MPRGRDPSGGNGMAGQIVHKSRTARTCDALRTMIVHAAYAPGAKLRIDQLCKTLEASTGAVREALSRLTAEGLVVAEPQKGFVVAPISRRDLSDLTEARVTIECLCLARSIKRGDVEWEARVLALQHRLRALDGAASVPDSPEAARWHALHAEFHDELASCCGNLWWLRLRTQLFLQSERYRRLSGPVDEDGRDITGEHDLIVKHAVARRTEEAVAAMARHLNRTTEILLGSSLPFMDPADG